MEFNKDKWIKDGKILNMQKKKKKINMNFLFI